jgi:Tfp pilus assembly protein PilO
MFDGALRWILRHEKRRWIVITATFLTGVLIGLPAVEEYMAAGARMRDAQEKLTEAKRQLQHLPELKRLFDARKQELQGLEAKAVTPQEIANLHATLQQLIRETGCEMRRLDIGEPSTRAWMSSDSPTRRGKVGALGQETPFQLVSRTAVLRMEGTMTNLYRFLARVSQLDRFIHTRQVRLDRSQRNEEVTELEMQFELFDLVRKKSV